MMGSAQAGGERAVDHLADTAAQEVPTEAGATVSPSAGVVYHCAYVTRRGVDIKVRVRLRFIDGDVVEIRASRVLDNTLLGADVPLTDEEEDRIVGEVLGG